MMTVGIFYKEPKPNEFDDVTYLRIYHNVINFSAIGQLRLNIDCITEIVSVAEELKDIEKIMILMEDEVDKDADN